MFWASADVQIWNNPDDLVQEEESETDCKKDGDPQIV